MFAVIVGFVVLAVLVGFIAGWKACNWWYKSYQYTSADVNDATQEGFVNGVVAATKAFTRFNVNISQKTGLVKILVGGTCLYHLEGFAEKVELKQGAPNGRH